MVHHRDRRELRLVAREQAKRVQEDLAAWQIETRCRLVEQHDPWPVHQRAGEQRALALTL